MSRKNIAEVVKGGGMFLALVNGLTEGIAKRGGYLEQLYYLTTPHGKANLDSVVDHLLTLPWRAPKSILMCIARQCSLKDGNDHEIATSDEHFFWEMGLREYGIPFVRFGSEDDREKEYSVEELRSELDQKPLVSGMVVRWRGDEYYLVGISFGPRGVHTAGEIIDISGIDFVHLALTKYIDIEN